MLRSARIILLLSGTQLRVLIRSRATAIFMLIPGIILYTIFTSIFSGAAGRPFRVAVIDQDHSPASQKLIEMLRANNVKVITHEGEDPEKPLLTEDSAREAILHEGLFRVALVIPKGYSESPTTFNDQHHGVDLIYDESQPLEAEIVSGMVQMAAGRALFEKLGGALGMDDSSATPAADNKDVTAVADAVTPRRLIQVHPRGVAKSGMPNAAKHSFLAGIVPMFILFGAAGAARGMLESLRRGEIRRLLAAPIAPFHILTGQLVTCLVVSFVQCYAMYLYAWIVFDVAIWSITIGLFVLTLATCLSATALGMLMASVCRTGEQLDSLGSIIILAMSAIGGSMVPRFIMPLFMQKLGLLTINGWAYDGLMALIRHEGFAGVAGPVAVLSLAAAVFLAVASSALKRRLSEKPSA